MDSRICELLANIEADEKWYFEDAIRKSKCQIKEMTSLHSNRRFEEKRNELLMQQIWNGMHYSNKRLLEANM